METTESVIDTLDQLDKKCKSIPSPLKEFCECMLVLIRYNMQLDEYTKNSVLHPYLYSLRRKMMRFKYRFPAGNIITSFSLLIDKMTKVNSAHLKIIDPNELNFFNAHVEKMKNMQTHFERTMEVKI